MSIINIPKPCPEKVTSMSKSGNGFYCQSCTRVVVDFTQKTDSEILDYINSRNGERTCGYFRNEQVARKRDWPFEMVRFVAAVALAFGSMLFITSCGTAGESNAKKMEDSTKMADSLAKANEFHGTLGVVLCEPPPMQDSAHIIGFTEPEIEDSTK